MGLLRRLLGGGNGDWTPRPFHANQTPQQVEEWFAHVPPWSALDASVRDAFIERLMGNPMFEVFVHVSMEEKLVSQYVALKRLADTGVYPAIYAQTAAILCKSGSANREKFVALLENPGANKESLGSLYGAAINAFEAAINVEPEFVIAYGEMAVTRMLLQKRLDAADWCSQGLAVIARQREKPLPNHPDMDLAGTAREIEQQLTSILADIAGT